MQESPSAAPRVPQMPAPPEKGPHAGQQLLRAGVLGASDLASRSHVALLRGFEAPGTVQRNTRESKPGVKDLMGCSSSH